MQYDNNDLRAQRLRNRWLACATGTIVVLSLGSLGSLGYAAPKLPAGTYACGTSCVDKTIDNKKCKVCTTTICKKGPKGEELIAGNATETSCEAAQRPQGGATRPLVVPVPPPATH